MTIARRRSCGPINMVQSIDLLLLHVTAIIALFVGSRIPVSQAWSVTGGRIHTTSSDVLVSFRRRTSTCHHDSERSSSANQYYHHPQYHDTSLIRLPMIKSDWFPGSGGGSSSSSSNPSDRSTKSGPTTTSSQQQSLPRDVKEAVSRCKDSVQQALRKQQSRMAIDFPVGTKFGVERSSAKQRRGRTVDNGDDDVATPTLNDLERSDRELARLFVEMFLPVGGDRIAVVFRDAQMADLAKKQWKDDSTANKSRILSLDRRRQTNNANNNKGKDRKPKGFAAKLAAELDDSKDSSGPFKLPEGTEVAVFVSPGPKELVIVERICQEVGMETLIILLNARLSSITNFGSSAATQLFQQQFEPVFVLDAGPQQASPGCILYRSYPQNWVLGRKPKVGPPKTILITPHRPTEAECRDAYESIELSSLEKGVESTMENIAGWFR